MRVYGERWCSVRQNNILQRRHCESMITAIELGNGTCGGDIGICFHVGVAIERDKLEMRVVRMNVVAYER